MSSTTLKYANALTGVTLLAAMAVAMVAGEARGRMQVSLMDGDIQPPRESALLVRSDEARFEAGSLKLAKHVLRGLPATVTIVIPVD